MAGKVRSTINISRGNKIFEETLRNRFKDCHAENRKVYNEIIISLMHSI